jgi:DNA invertase Pin-like site-specific DNA recombinase
VKSVAIQTANSEGFAERKGWPVVARYDDDAISGALATRLRGRAQMLAAAVAGTFDVLIVRDIDRLSRNDEELPGIIYTLRDAGVEVWQYTDGTRIDTSTAMARGMLTMKATFSAVEREKAQTRTHEVLRGKAALGHVVGGRVYGYTNVDVLGEPGADGRRRRLYVRRDIHREQAAVLLRMFTLYAEGKGFTRIAKALNGDSVAPARGRGPARGWSPTAVREMLRRELYRGVVVWDRTQKIVRKGAKGQRRRPESEVLRIEVPELRIIPEALWTAVQRRLTQAAVASTGFPRRALAARLESPYLLSGLAQCAACGGSLVAMTRAHGQRTRAAFYGCVYHYKRGARICKNRVVIQQEQLNDAVIGRLMAVLDERRLRAAVAEALELAKRDDHDRDERRAGLQRDLARVETHIGHLLDALKAGKATETILTALQAEEERKKAITGQLAALNGERAPASLDRKRLEARLIARARQIRADLERRGPAARPILQRVFGDRIACHAFDEPGRRGYAFKATGTYGDRMTSEANGENGPNGIRTRV